MPLDLVKRPKISAVRRLKTGITFVCLQLICPPIWQEPNTTDLPFSIRLGQEHAEKSNIKCACMQTIFFCIVWHYSHMVRGQEPIPKACRWINLNLLPEFCRNSIYALVGLITWMRWAGGSSASLFHPPWTQPWCYFLSLCAERDAMKQWLDILFLPNEEKEGMFLQGGGLGLAGHCANSPAWTF